MAVSIWLTVSFLMATAAALVLLSAAPPPPAVLAFLGDIAFYPEPGDGVWGMANPVVRLQTPPIWLDQFTRYFQKFFRHMWDGPREKKLKRWNIKYVSESGIMTVRPRPPRRCRAQARRRKNKNQVHGMERWVSDSELIRRSWYRLRYRFQGVCKCSGTFPIFSHGIEAIPMPAATQSFLHFIMWLNLYSWYLQGSPFGVWYTAVSRSST